MKIEDVEIRWLGHAGFIIKNSQVVYIDPYNINESEKADIILITHSHYDHCSIADIEKIVKDGTKIILTADCQSKITKLPQKIEMQIIEPGEELSLGSVKIKAVSAYNVNKNFHEKAEGWLGYIVKINNLIVYHAGDTDLISEMNNLTGFGKQGNKFIAMLPVGGKFTMTAEEAAQAAKIINPSLAIPIHYGSIIGSEEDALRFIELCKEAGINAEKLEK